jgi:hypothetical protein
VEEGGELRSQKWCESKPPLKAMQLRTYITSNPRAARGNPLGIRPHLDLDEGSVNEKGMVVETSNHSINRRHGGSGHRDRIVSARYHNGRVFLQAHTELSLRLIGGYTHSMKEEGADKRL